MGRGVNKVILVGSLGADPDVRYTGGGAAVANLNLATNESYKDKVSGEWQERTEWHRVVLFGRMGEVAKEYLRKGSQIYIEGRLQTRKWQDKEGRDHYTTEIIATDMQMLGGRQSPPATPYQPTAEAPTPTVPASANNKSHAGATSHYDPPSFNDDDIPF